MDRRPKLVGGFADEDGKPRKRCVASLDPLCFRLTNRESSDGTPLALATARGKAAVRMRIDVNLLSSVWRVPPENALTLRCAPKTFQSQIIIEAAAEHQQGQSRLLLLGQCLVASENLPQNASR